MRHGEVWWVRLGDGTRRPYLILTRDVAIPLLHSIIAVPATRTVRGIPTEVELDEQDGMPHSCALTLDNLQLMPKDMFVSPICRLVRTNSVRYVRHSHSASTVEPTGATATARITNGSRLDP